MPFRPAPGMEKGPDGPAIRPAGRRKVGYFSLVVGSLQRIQVRGTSRLLAWALAVRSAQTFTFRGLRKQT